MDESLRQAVALLAIAIVVAIAARQFRLPYTVGLVIVGAILTLSNPGFVPHLTHDLIFDLLLPPLLFEAALSMSWREVQRDFFPIAVLATLGTVIAACVVTGGMVWLLDWPAPSALVFGVLIAATDPVAIIAMFKDNKLKGRLCLLVEGESLLNDGVAAVLFVMALAWAQAAGHTQASFATVTTLVRIVLGGVIIGAVFGGVAVLVAKRTSEHLIEGALTTVAAYGSFSAADYFDVSGVLATVTAGLVLGNLDLLSTDEKGYLSLKGREFIISFWEFAAFLANSVVFLLIGFDVAAMPFQSYSPRLESGGEFEPLRTLGVPPGRSRIVADTMIAFRVAYRIGANWLVIPALLAPEQPEHDFRPEDALAFRFDFGGFLPRHVLPALVVEYYQDIAKVKGREIVWQNGVLLRPINRQPRRRSACQGRLP